VLIIDTTLPVGKPITGKVNGCGADVPIILIGEFVANNVLVCCTG